MGDPVRVLLSVLRVGSREPHPHADEAVCREPRMTMSLKEIVAKQGGSLTTDIYRSADGIRRPRVASIA